ncbi:MAG: FecR domain-containing protein [Tannerella sp.]|jgi:ferric-dicitrate binding protein FerR (iron transport regulator)|nr:FecR domain-containing protein [Tannerella sp.]
MQEKMTDGKKQTIDRFERYINGLYTQADAEALWATMQSGDGYAQSGEVMDRVWNEAVQIPSEARYRQYRSEAEQLLKRLRRQEKTFSLLTLLKYAAMVCVVVATGLAVYTFSGGESKQEVACRTLRVAHGEREQVIFSDGTKVILNAGSSLTYPGKFEHDKRVVHLDGEAFFDVAKNRSRPFIVQTKSADIEVLGTSFNVKAHDEDEFVSVTVESGKVRVNMEDAVMQLLPDEQFFLDKTKNEIFRKHANMEKTKSWISGELYFNKTPIRSVINELMRHYNCIIAFEGGQMPAEYISGAHDNKTLDAVLNSIYYTAGIKYRKETGKIILYMEKDIQP